MECFNCLNSTSGTCDIHTREINTEGWTTATTTSNFEPRRYSRDEVLANILYFSRLLIKLKWYQLSKKKYYKDELQIWFRTLDKFIARDKK